jgi:hypothetical protein
MRTVRTKVYQFNELNDEAKQAAIEKYRNEDHDFAEWAIDDCALLEPIESELIELFGVDYNFPLIKNNRTDIYFDTDRNRFLDCSKAIEVTNDKQFLAWLGITDEFLLQKISYCIFTPSGRNSDTTIVFDFDEDFDTLTGQERESVELAEDKFNNHIQHVLKGIEADIDYRYSDEAIIEDIEANEYEFLSNGKQF